MKFYLVPIGEQFSFQNKSYTKSGPLTASAETDGQNKMIPRSANVKLLNSTNQSLQGSVDKEPILNITVYHKVCLECLDDIQNDISKEKFDAIKDKITIAYQQLIKNR